MPQVNWGHATPLRSCALGLVWPSTRYLHEDHSIDSRQRIAASIAALAACGPAVAIEGGVEGAASSFNHIGYLGVQISDNWVLTAAHTQREVGWTFSNGFGAAQVAQVYTASSQSFPTDDLALLRLDTPIAQTSQLTLLQSALPFGKLDAPVDATIVSGRLGAQGPRQYAHTAHPRGGCAGRSRRRRPTPAGAGELAADL